MFILTKSWVTFGVSKKFKSRKAPIGKAFRGLFDSHFRLKLKEGARTMRFAGFTESSRSKAVARSLKDALFFRESHEITDLKNEWVIAWTGPAYARLSSASMVDVYFRMVADAKAEANWKMLIGINTTSFKLNTEKLRSLVAESEPYIDAQEQYKRIRWHDVVLLLLLQKIAAPTSELNRYATFHLQNLVLLNSEASEIYANLNAPIFT